MSVSPSFASLGSAQTASPAPLLHIQGLQTRLGLGDASLRVVDGLDLDIRRGETFALLGESGCGKSMTALSLMRLLPPGGHIIGGSVRLGETELLRLPESAMRRVRGGRLAMIFQEPQTSLNPVLTVGHQIGEAVVTHTPLSRRSLAERVRELLAAVGIPDPERRARDYPHQLSGGMKQRVMIAMALAGEPELLIADEPTTALDVTIQAQVLRLLKGLQQETGLAILLITHDLGVVAETADRLAVMYAGQIVETAISAAFFARLAHPYSRKLMDSLPAPEKRQDRLAVIPGRVPPLDQPFTGCRFADRCDRVMPLCRQGPPTWREPWPGHGVRCFLWEPSEEIATGGEASLEVAGTLLAPGALAGAENATVDASLRLTVQTPSPQPSPTGGEGARESADPAAEAPLACAAEAPLACAAEAPLACTAEAPLACAADAPLGREWSERVPLREVGASREGWVNSPRPVSERKPLRDVGASLLEVQGLQVHFPIHKGLFRRVVGQVRAVDGIDLSLRVGRTLALVGESGCGKTTAGKGLLQLIRPSAGRVDYQGRNLVGLSYAAMRPFRRDLQIIFQDPFASMNPRLLVGDIIGEGLQALGLARSRAERRQRVLELLEEVGLAADAIDRYPHEFSGGQRQRICIARSLAVGPRLIVCDEPTSALDVSVQAQILNLLKGLQERMGLAYLFITHNISVVSYLAHEVAVMYLGRIVEHGRVEEVLDEPRHPYTQALLSAVPRIHQDPHRRVIRLEGDLPSPANPPPGCHFHPRCPMAKPECRQAYPPAVQLSETRSVHCLRV